MATRTFVDAGVIIDAARGNQPLSAAAFRLTVDTDRTFLTSPFLYLEVVPKALYYRQTRELALYRSYFENPDVVWWRDLDACYDLARTEAERCGLNAQDALHVAAAHLLGADELITTEQPGRSIYRTQLVRVVQLLP